MNNPSIKFKYLTFICVIIITIASTDNSIASEAKNVKPAPAITKNREEPTETKQNTDKNKHKGKLVETIGSQQNTSIPAQSPNPTQNNKNQETVSQNKIEYYTKWLVIVAICQLFTFIAQLIAMAIQTKRLRETVEATKKAADAADISAKANIGIELPVVRATPVDLISTNELIPDEGPYGGTVNDRYPTKYSAFGYIDFKNYGRTPAFPEQISVGWKVCERLPEKPEYIKTANTNHASIIKPGEGFTADIHCGIKLTEDEITAMAKEQSWLWVYGCLHYTDFLNIKRAARFCWRFANRNHHNIFCFFASDGEPPKAYTE